MTDRETPRRPRVFEPDDPRLTETAVAPPLAAQPEPATPSPDPGRVTLPNSRDLSAGVRWGSLLLSALAGLAALAAGVWFARFVSVLLGRDDWIGWAAYALIAVAGLAALILLAREIAGIVRLGRLGRLRKLANQIVADPDPKLERQLVRDLAALSAKRPENAWALARFREHQGDVYDAGGLLKVAERELIVPLDREARRTVFASAKRVATVTTLSPIAAVSIAFVLIENIRLLRAVAALYGGRPGVVGGLRLARMVIAHIIATGGLAMTDDLLGQFLGQDLMRRVSRRLGEGAFNGALTARLGAAAIEVIRPLPYIEAAPVRARDILAELFRKPTVAASAKDTKE